MRMLRSSSHATMERLAQSANAVSMCCVVRFVDIPVTVHSKRSPPQPHVAVLVTLCASGGLA